MYVRVRVTASARKEHIERTSPDHFDIVVCEPAVRNLANTRARILVAQALAVMPSAVRIVSGHHSPTKIMSVVV